MKTQDILSLATLFEKKAAYTADPYDSNFRNQVINTRLDGKNFSFREVANVVLQDLQKIDPTEKNPAVVQASHALLDILNSLKVPEPNEMLSAANVALNVVKTNVPSDAQKLQIANYLVRLTQLLINKFFAQKPIADTSKGKELPPGAAEAQKEGTAIFLQRMYKLIKSGKQPSEKDLAQWNEYKSFYVRRLNGINSLKEKTKAQEEEKNLLHFMLKNMPR